MKEWSSPYNPFNSMKVLLWKQHLEGCATGNYLPPVTVDIDPSNRCNFDCVWCFPAKTKILMSDMSYKYIEDVKINDWVIGFKKHKQWKTTKTKVVGLTKRKTDKLIVIETTNGYIKCTPDHKLWQSRGRWKHAKNFKVGDKITSFGQIKKENNNLEFKKGWLAGMSDGDGCFWKTKNRSQFRLAVKDKEILDRFKAWSLEIGFELYDGNCKSDSRYGDKNLPAIYLTQNKQVDSFAEKLSQIKDIRSYAEGYLGGIFDSEGSFSQNVLRIAQEKKELTIRKIEQMLLIAGFDFKKEKKGFRIKGGIQEYFRFFQTTNPILTRKKEKLIGSTLKSNVIVTKITKLKTDEWVYDLETETHDFVAEGMRVHNCNAFDMMNTKAKTKDMSKRHMRRLVSFLTDWKDENGNGPRSACIAGGGEPFMNPETPNLLEFMHLNDLESGVITNGSLITDEIANILAKTCRWVGISTDAGTSETFNIVKGIKGNLFKKVTENIKKLTSLTQNTNCDIAYKYLIHPDNVKEIGQAAKLAKELGCKDFHVRPVGWINLTKTNGTKIDLNKYSEYINKGMAEARALEDDNFHVYGITHKFQPDLTPKKNFSKCWAIPLLPTFGADGWVHTCFDMRGKEDLKLCRHDPDPSEIAKFWGSENHRAIVNSINIEECPRCTFSAYNEIVEKVIINDKMCKFFP